MWIASVVLQVSLASVPSGPVTFTQDEGRASIMVNASGVVTRADNALAVRLGDIRVVDNPANANSLVYENYRVCLARKVDEGWEMASCSEPVKVRVLVQSNRRQSLPDQEVEIPAPAQIPDGPLWLVLEMNSRLTAGRVDTARAITRQLPEGRAIGSR